MTEMLPLLLAWIAGGALGAVFFGGLWWTLPKGLSSERPALWLFGSFLVRMSIALSGIYLVGRGHWQRMMLCLLGLAMARPVVTWLTRPLGNNQTRPTQVRDAP